MLEGTQGTEQVLFLSRFLFDSPCIVVIVMQLSIVSLHPHYPGNSRVVAGTYLEIYRILCPYRPGTYPGLMQGDISFKRARIYPGVYSGCPKKYSRLCWVPGSDSKMAFSHNTRSASWILRPISAKFLNAIAMLGRYSIMDLRIVEQG